MTTLHLELGERGYDITVGRALLSDAGKFFNLDRRVFIVTDDGVPKEYASAVAACAKEAVIVTVPQGEGSKSPEVYTDLLMRMLDFGMTRTDCAVAVGGGVVGDLTGFVAASYMRGIDFYNVPTTLLSQVDSSIGGKCAINLGGVKNIVGAFHQPRGVLIDVDTLKTLDARQIANGAAESVKMACTSDKALFELIEREGITDESLTDIIIGSLKIKKAVVEADEREGGLRKILNFGHTFGHAIEADEKLNTLYHGECVALGMLPVSSESVKKRLIPVLEKLSLPTVWNGNVDEACKFISHDKKCDGAKLSVVLVDEIGSYRIEKLEVEKFIEMIKRECAF